MGADLADLVADNATELDEVVFGTDFGGITDIKVGPDGLLYVLSFNGTIYAISPGEPTGEIIIDNAPAGQSGSGRSFTGTWCTSPFGADSLFSCGIGSDTYRWTPTLPSNGTYAVSVRWTQLSSRSTAVPITVCHAGGCTTLNFNQQQNGAQWIAHGQYNFNAGTSGYVQVTDQNGQAAAAAVRFVFVP